MTPTRPTLEQLRARGWCEHGARWALELPPAVDVEQLAADLEPALAAWHDLEPVSLEPEPEIPA